MLCKSFSYLWCEIVIVRFNSIPVGLPDATHPFIAAGVLPIGTIYFNGPEISVVSVSIYS